MTYSCSRCGASGCKLWREYQTLEPQLLCAPCAAADQSKDISDMDERGTYTSNYGWAHQQRTDQIGWYVPAVTVEDGSLAFWGYTSVPDDAVARWRGLPSLPAKVMETA